MRLQRHTTIIIGVMIFLLSTSSISTNNNTNVTIPLTNPTQISTLTEITESSQLSTNNNSAQTTTSFEMTNVTDIFAELTTSGINSTTAEPITIAYLNYSREYEQLTSVPRTIPTVTTEISLAHNSITNVTSQLQLLSYLTYLDLCDNLIAYVSPDAFRGTLIRVNFH